MDLTLYIITDEKIGLDRSHVELAREALKGGATVIQLRDKQKSSRELYLIGLEIKKLTRKYNALFIVNDRLDVALAVEADGVHLGQDDLPISVVRKISDKAAKKLIIGVSVSNISQALDAIKFKADYLSVQSIFPTTSKDDVGVVGLEMLRKIKMISKIPVIAIGGINLDNVEKVMEAGANGIAVISAVVGKKNVKQAVIELRKKMLKS